jgi:cadherin domain-containing protein/parallel beta helix pectate lyase-like protein/type IX secretion system substrate protein
MILIISNSIYSQNIIYVKGNASGNNNGTNWMDAYKNIQIALDNATSDDSIWVAAGVYKPTQDSLGNSYPVNERTKTFLMVDGVALIGGFAGGESSFNERDIENNETILSGDLGIENDTSDNSYHVITGVDNYSINGFTITKGNANNTDKIQYAGGGIFNIAVGDISIESCRFTNNYAFAGGGIGNYFCTGSMEIKNCWFIADTAYNSTSNSGEGGAIANWDFAPVITNCIFVDNYAYTYGAAVFNWGGGSTTIITNSTFYNNSTSYTNPSVDEGGAVHNRGVTSTITNSILWNNNNDDFAGSNGGGLSIEYSCTEEFLALYSVHSYINSDPLFWDADNFDFDLQKTSPCIDAGNGEEAPELDYYGNGRYDSPTVADAGTGAISYTDIGAIENQGYPEISGHVTQDTTWTHKWIQITGDLTVDAGATLTINPGTKVDFNGYYKLIVNGVILAEGTEKDSIIFTTDDPATGYHGIRFESNTSTDSSKFSFCKFEYGKATGASYEATGGAIYSNGFELISIKNSSFLNNSATGGGAIYLRSGASSVIANNRFINNDGGNYFGGAITVESGSTAKIINNLFSNNSAQDGGAIGLFNNVEFVNNTLTNNNATTSGGGIYLSGTNSSSLKNCIFYGNIGINGNQIYLRDDDTDPNFINCDIQGGTDAFGLYTAVTYDGTYTNNIDSDPVFIDPNAGVGNQADAWQSDWTLQSTSPCINTGLSDTTGLSLPTRDIDGNLRVINNVIDMGAYEATAIPACGNITSDTDWNSDTVKVNCDITIDNTYTLTIHPGTVVEFQGDYQINVNGTLLALGMELDSIIFTRNDTTGFSDTSIVDGGWGGIWFDEVEPANDSSKFAYCKFEFAKAKGDNAEASGGAINIRLTSKISFDNCLFQNNLTVGQYAGGAAMAISNSAAMPIRNCTFINNVAWSPYFAGGGAIYLDVGSPYILNNKFFNNVADSCSGGAIYCRGAGSPRILNNVFTNNYARYGGAMLFASENDPTVYNNTIAYNDSKFGGGLTCYENANPDVKNNIFYANVDSAGGSQVYIFDNASQPNFSYNLIQGGSGEIGTEDTVAYVGNYENNLNEDPLFVKPTTAAGIGYDGSKANWTLLGDNPCINAGTADTVGMKIPVTDLSENLRIYNDVRIDIGAYEFLNNHPEISAQYFSVNENAANTTIVGTCTATDIDGDGYGFSILSGNTNNAFAISSSGEVTVNTSSELDFETVPDNKYELIVQAEDDGIGTLLDTCVVTINLNDVNDAPVINPFVFSLDENSVNSSIVGTILGTDVDIPSQTLSYSIIGGDYAANFNINSSTGVITVADSTPLDFETNSSLTLTVQVQDDGTGNLTDNSTVTINLNDVNDNPTIANQSFSINEQSPSLTPIGNVVASDVDSPAQNLTYSIIAGNENQAFAIFPSTGELRVNIKDSVDYELATSQIIKVLVTDNGIGSLTKSADITVNINNINDNAPVFEDVIVSFSEFAGETDLVAEFTATDIDELGGFAYSIVSGNENSVFYLQNGNGNRLYMTASGFRNYLNYEDYQNFDLVIAVSDGDSITEANLTINIIDENEHPILEAFGFSIDELSPNNTLVGTISGTDPDIGQNLYYYIDYGNENKAFVLDSVSGEIRVLDSFQLNYEGMYPSYNLQIRVQDDGDPSYYSMNYITVSVVDINEAPVVNPSSFELFENAAANQVIGTVTAIHEDAYQTISYSIIDGNSDGIFAINSVTGSLSLQLADMLDYETTTEYELIVEARDNTSLYDTALVTIIVENINEFPTIPNYEFTIDENTPYETVVGTAQATDPENGPITYYFVWDNLYPAFRVDNSTGVISVFEDDSVDFEYRSKFVITLAARDNEWQIAYSTITINISDVNEAPTVSHKDFSVQENQPLNHVIGIVEANTDAGETIEFSITGGNYYEMFGINPNTGELYVHNADSLNYELFPYFNLTIRATDNSIEHYWGENSATVNLENINDAPKLDAQKFYYFGDPNVNPYVGQLFATDDDQDMIFYSIESGNLNETFAITESFGVISVLNNDEINPNEIATYELIVRASDQNLSDTAIVTIQLTPDGIPYLELDKIVNVYPNPVKDLLNLKFNSLRNSASLKIIDLKDQILFEEEIESDTQIDMSEFSSGMYVLIINYAGRSYYGRIVKE